MHHVYKFFFSSYQKFIGTLLVFMCLYIFWNDSTRRIIVTKLHLILYDVFAILIMVFVLITNKQKNNEVMWKTFLRKAFIDVNFDIYC